MSRLPSSLHSPWRVPCSVPFLLSPFYFLAIVLVVVMFITIVMMVLVMFPGAFAMELATALIRPMNPSMMLAPMPGHPHPFVAIVPISGALVIGPIADIDRDLDRHGAWPEEHANRQKSRCKNCEFVFHSVFNCSHEG